VGRAKGRRLFGGVGGAVRIAVRSISEKRENQDRVVTRVFDGALFVALADGAGGQMGGARAAQIAVDVALGCAQNAPDLQGLDWAGCLERADAAMESDAEAGITTAVVLAAGEGWLAGASVGDSEAWLIGANSSVDLTAHQRRKPFVGQSARGKTFGAKWDGETLLVGSDGLFKYVSRETVEAIARGAELEAVADALLERVRYPSGALPDDVSLVLARF